MECKYIKLTNGDNIIACVEGSDLTSKQFVEVVDPVQISSFKFPNNGVVIETFVMQPWVKMAEESKFTISTASIILATNINDNAMQQYQRYLEDMKNMPSHSTSDMDLSDIQDETDEMEELLESIFEETEEEDDGRTTTRTLH